MRRSRRAYLLAGGLLIGVIVVMMLVPEKLTSVSPNYWDARTSILLGTPPFAPGGQHPLGTDQFGRDVWSRIVYGSRWSMFFAFLIMTARLLAAVPAALLSTFGPKRIGWFVERLYVMTSAIPPLLIYILILSVPQLRVIGLWPSVTLTVTLMTLMEWPRVAVVLKGRLNSLLAEPFVEGAVAVGNSRWQLFKNHLFPHLWPVLLQLVAAEMARALVVIAQLAIFGIMVGGGVVNIIDNGRGGDKYIVTSGIPEWGTLLGDGRFDIRAHPWIPFPPAVAFLLGVVGFNLLSQGLETVTFSIQEIKEATTSRLSRRWLWAALAVPVTALLWYFQGLPWGREAGIADLAARQAAALTEKNPGAFAATLGSDERDLQRWAEQLVQGDVQMVSVKPVDLRITGAAATASWRVTVGRRTEPPFVFNRQTTLVRRWGQWYEQGEAFTPVQGYHTDVSAIYNPVDPRPQVIPTRWTVQFLGTAADHAFESVAGLFPAKAGAPRPQVKLYPSYEKFAQAVGPVLPPGANIWYEPGQPIRMAPEYLRGSKRWDVERTLAYEMMKFLTATRLGQDRVSPLTMGAWDLHLEKERDTYRIDTGKLVGEPFSTLDELFALRSDQLSQQRQAVYAVQAALLAEYAEARLPERPIIAPDVASLAARLGLTPAEFGRQYYDYVLERVLSESLVKIPAARVRIPAGLAEAVAAQKPPTVPGLARYEATLMDFETDKNGVTTVLVMEVATFADGDQVSGIVSQTWQNWSATEWTVMKQTSLVQNR